MTNADRTGPELRFFFCELLFPRSRKNLGRKQLTSPYYEIQKRLTTLHFLFLNKKAGTMSEELFSEQSGRSLRITMVLVLSILCGSFILACIPGSFPKIMLWILNSCNIMWNECITCTTTTAFSSPKIYHLIVLCSQNNPGFNPFATCWLCCSCISWCLTHAYIFTF